MRRRRFAKKEEPRPGGPVPEPDPRSPPPKPVKELARARGELQELLLGRDAHVATGYGFGDDPGDRAPAWRLYVFTDLPAGELELPGEVMGFPVARRGVPRPGRRPASKWGA